MAVGDINDAQPAVSETGVGVLVDSVSVRTAMPDRLHHGYDHRGRSVRRPLAIDKSGNPAHDAVRNLPPGVEREPQPGAGC
jgi:hypothetical protein